MFVEQCFRLVLFAIFITFTYVSAATDYLRKDLKNCTEKELKFVDRSITYLTSPGVGGARLPENPQELKTFCKLVKLPLKYHIKTQTPKLKS